MVEQVPTYQAEYDENIKDSKPTKDILVEFFAKLQDAGASIPIEEEEEEEEGEDEGQNSQI